MNNYLLGWIIGVLVTLLVILILAGCSSYAYRDGAVEISQTTLGGRSVIGPTGHNLTMPTMQLDGGLLVEIDAPGGIEGLFTASGGSYGPHVVDISVNVTGISQPTGPGPSSWTTFYSTNTERGFTQTLLRGMQFGLGWIFGDVLNNRNDNKLIRDTVETQASVAETAIKTQ